MGEALVELDRGVDVTQQTPALGQHQAHVLAAAQSLRTRHHRRLQPPPLLRDLFELGDQLRQPALCRSSSRLASKAAAETSICA